MGNLICKKEVEQKKSDEHIKEFVKKLLNNKKTNITMIPDTIEGKFYEDVLTALVYDLKEVLDTVKIQFLDYEITLNLHPINNEIKHNVSLDCIESNISPISNIASISNIVPINNIKPINNLY